MLKWQEVTWSSVDCTMATRFLFHCLLDITMICGLLYKTVHIHNGHTGARIEKAMSVYILFSSRVICQVDIEIIGIQMNIMPEELSTEFWVMVIEWTVVLSSSKMPTRPWIPGSDWVVRATRVINNNLLWVVKCFWFMSITNKGHQKNG